MSTSTIQAAPLLPTIDARPAYCPGVTANNQSYILHLALSTAQLDGNLTLPINLTYEDLDTTMQKVLEATSESTYTKCLEYSTPFPSTLSRPAVCSSAYQCDYDAGRFPQYITHVVCNWNRVSYSKGGQQGDCQCRPIYRPLTVLKFVGCDPYEQWRMEEQVVSVGCSCEKIM